MVQQMQVVSFSFTQNGNIVDIEAIVCILLFMKPY